MAAYDLAYSNLRPIYDYFRSEADNGTSQRELPNLSDVEIQLEYEYVENKIEHQFSGSFAKKDFDKTLNILQRAKSLIDEDGMWIGLRKHQLAYPDNELESNLKSKLKSLITELEKEDSTQINKLSQGDSRQTLRDSFEMIKAYSEVYEDKTQLAELSNFYMSFAINSPAMQSYLLSLQKKQRMQHFVADLTMVWFLLRKE